MIDGRAAVRSTLATLLPGEGIPPLADLFEAELSEYAEIIVGPGGKPAGFMTRGEGQAFTERVRVAIAQLQLPEAASAHHLELARWFEHTRGFFKAEWHKTATGVEPLAAIYFRRRPPIDEVLARLDLTAAARERFAALARTVDKQTVHFVSAAFRPGHPVHHKLYFSQWVTPDTRAAVADGIGRVFDLYGFGAGVRDAWRPCHERCLGAADGETTIFVSASASPDGPSTTFKIDYPEVDAAVAAQWVPEAQRAAVMTDARRAQGFGGTRHMTFLGVRFATDRPAPSLKYYCDLPGSK